MNSVMMVVGLQSNMSSITENEQGNKGEGEIERESGRVDEYSSGQRPAEESTLFAHRSHCHETG